MSLGHASRRGARHALLLVLLGGCASGRISANDEPAAPSARVEVVAARAANTARPVESIGIVVDRARRELGFESGGRVAAVLVDESDQVRAGQVLARLDTGALDAQLAEAQASLAQAERDAARASALLERGAVASRAVDDSSTGVDVARASLRLVRHHRSRSVLVAPENGTVLRRLAEVGEIIGPGAPVVMLSPTDEGRAVRFGVIDRDVVRIAVGDAATVRLDAVPGALFEGRIAEIAELPSERTGTFVVEVTLDAAPLPRAGLVARVHVEPSARADVILIPVEALFEADGDRGSVFVLGEDRVSVARRAVRAAHLAGAELVVAEGLAEGELVVVSGFARLARGVRVVATTRERHAP